MTDYPYILKTSTLREVLEKMQEMAAPDSFNIKTLKTMGYTSSNDRPVVKILRFLGFIDSHGKPTERYMNYRVSPGSVLAEAIKESYSELFGLYPDAHRKDAETLQNYFTAHMNVGKRALNSAVSTFKTLCDLADFNAEVDDTIKRGVSVPKSADIDLSAQATAPKERSNTPAVNINIELVLPKTDNAETYDKLFESMKKHLFSD